MRDGIGQQNLRQLDGGFFGIRCPHLGVECLIHQLVKLHMHFGCRTSLGLKLKVSTEALAVELGVSAQPLQQSYDKYKGRVTWCWLVSLWEKCSKFKIKVKFRNLGVLPPREKKTDGSWSYWRQKVSQTTSFAD